MADRIKVLMVAPHLRYGGSAQVVRLLATHLSRKQFAVHLSLLTHSTQEEPANLSETSIHCMNKTRVRYSLPALLKLAWRLRPEVIFSSMIHVNLALLLMRRILPERTAIVIRQNGEIKLQRFSLTYWMVKILYSKADRVICQTPAMARQLKAITRLDDKRIQVICNPVAPHSDRSLNRQPVALQMHSAPRLVAVGRLSHEKGFDLLLEAMVQVRIQHPRVSLTLLGDGPEHASLQALCAFLSLHTHVHFSGQVNDPAPYLNNADLFVLPSRSDAMPNALLEAAEAGLPLVATPCSEGLMDLLQNCNGVWMAAASTSDDLAEAILQALANVPTHTRFEHSFLEPFKLTHAINRYEACFLSAQQERCG